MGEYLMKYIVITKKHLTVTLASLVCALAVLISSVAVSAADSKKVPIYCVENNKKQIAISFDAAWGNEDTETLIDILSEYEVPATFFLVGSWVDKYPDSVKQLYDAGHDIGNHSNTHPYFSKLSSEQIAAEITACNEKIKKVTGYTPLLLRFPYGDYDNKSVETTENLGMYPIQWSVDSLDWKETSTAESIIKRVTEKVTDGSVILMHNAAVHTPEALPSILKTLKDEGYEFVLIRDLIMKENYKIDRSGKQIPLG